jgi:hypothetical protein
MRALIDLYISRETFHGNKIDYHFAVLKKTYKNNSSSSCVHQTDPYSFIVIEETYINSSTTLNYYLLVTSISTKRECHRKDINGHPYIYVCISTILYNKGKRSARQSTIKISQAKSKQKAKIKL